MHIQEARLGLQRTIAHVAIYNKALTATEVLQNFNVGRTI
jgi:hypothetical protein